jgi:thiol-disulfide isomerase/thioredoxin
MKLIPTLLFAVALLPAAVIPEVRALLNKQDFAGAEALVQKTKGGGEWTPELLEAHSWLGRGLLAMKQYDKALDYASETRKLCLAALKTRALDAEKRLPIAFGASMEVNGQALAAKGQLSEAIAFLQGELKTYFATSIRTRIQKNLHLLSLEGKPAPKLEWKETVTGSPSDVKSLNALKGKPTLLFFWAHWCGDCKAQAPILATLAEKHGAKGLRIVGPTQRYGYVAGGEDAAPDAEKAYIATVYEKFYKQIPGMAVPLSEENFKLYGSSTTPTLVLLDRTGAVRMYHPGKLTLEQLEAKILPWL